MKKFAMLLVLLAVAGVASADPISCAQPSAPNVLVPNFSCALGGLTFQGFSATNGGGVPSPQVNILLTSHLGSNGIVYLDFNPNLAAAAGAGVTDLLFSFQVLGGINQIDLTVGGSGAVISEIACSAQPIGTACPAGTLLGTAVAGSQQATQYSGLFPNTSPVYITKDIEVSSPAGQTFGELSFFEQSFHVVPEPGSMALFGSGLVALAGIIRRRIGK